MLTLAGKRLPPFPSDRIWLESRAPLQLLQFCIPTNFLSTKRQKKQDTSFTVSYLVDSCGLSPETAETISKKVQLKNSKRPDSVIRCLKDHGFTNTLVSSIVKNRPALLLSDVENTILPKLEFFHSIGVTGADLPRLITWNPDILCRSLKDCLIPCHDYLRSVLIYDEKVVAALKRSVRIYTQNVKEKMGSNVSLLRSTGVSEDNISTLLVRNPNALSVNTRKFDENLKIALSMGFDSSSLTFIKALEVILQTSNSTWNSKMEVYRNWGLSQDEILSAFKKFPTCMALSEKKIADGMNYLVNQVGLPPSYVASFPRVISFSLKKRIMPRCSFLAVLLSKGIVTTEDFTYSAALTLSEKNFLRRFVVRYQEQEPQLLDIFQNKCLE